MRRFSANYIYPITGNPIKNGVITANDVGEILEINNLDDQHPEKASMEFHNGVLVPGFVNSHCHLELSHLKRKFSPNKGLAGFISEVKEHRITDATTIQLDIKRAISTLRSQGVVAVGDICNTTDSIFFKTKSAIQFYNFIEIFGLNSDSANDIIKKGVEVRNKFDELFNKRNSVTPHATYSLSDKLWESLSELLSNQNGPISIHFGESKEEYKLLENRTGNLANYFASENIKINLPKNLDPFQVVKKYIPADKRVLFIHNTFTSPKEIDILKNSFNFPYFVLCPTSNLFIEGVLPDVQMLKKSGVTIAIGTDSYASSNTLSVFDQILILLKHFPELSFSEVLTWATLNGANALGFDKELGSFEVGKKPGINLITNFDFSNMKPTSKSQIKKIF